MEEELVGGTSSEFVVCSVVVDWAVAFLGSPGYPFKVMNLRMLLGSRTRASRSPKGNLSCSCMCDSFCRRYCLIKFRN